MLIIVFGLAGCGKSYVASSIAAHFSFHHVEADDWLTEDMIDSIKNKKSFTQEMRDNYTEIIISNTRDILVSNENVVLSQALYKERNRSRIIEEFPDAVFLQIVTSPDILIERLTARGDAITPDYANMIAKNFEQPLISENNSNNYYKIYNNSVGDNSIIEQYQNINGISRWVCKIKESEEEKNNIYIGK